MRTIEIPGLGEPSPERQAVVAAVEAQKEDLARLVGDAPSTNGDELPKTVPVAGGDIPITRVRPGKAEKVELTFVQDPEGTSIPVFKLTFNVSDICVRDHYISMLITDELGFQPSATMRFDLKFRGKTMPVIFMGAEFEFQSLGVRGISFLVDQKRQQRI